MKVYYTVQCNVPCTIDLPVQCTLLFNEIHSTPLHYKHKYEQIQHKINYMLTNINAIKECNLLYLCAIIYDLFYWIKRKLQYCVILLHMYST